MKAKQRGKTVSRKATVDFAHLWEYTVKTSLVRWHCTKLKEVMERPGEVPERSELKTDYAFLCSLNQTTKRAEFLELNEQGGWWSGLSMVKKFLSHKKYRKSSYRATYSIEHLLVVTCEVEIHHRFWAK